MDVGPPNDGAGAFSEINVTPLVDVMLVLLVIFMITAPLMTAGVRVDLPDEDAPAIAPSSESPRVTVADDGRIVLGEREITDDVELGLRSDPRVVEAGELFVEADADARYADVARVLAAAHAVGVEGLNFMVEPRGSEVH